jgi:signal transduction histidine kinase
MCDLPACHSADSIRKRGPIGPSPRMLNALLLAYCRRDNDENFARRSFQGMRAPGTRNMTSGECSPAPASPDPGLRSVDSGSVEAPEPMICNVLIVEDDPKLLLALRELLDGPDRSIVLAKSGAAALRSVQIDDFAVILLDVNLPDIDGFAIARQIRKREESRNTPIIFLTGARQDAASIFRSYEAGAVDYLVKPVVPEILKSKVSVFVDLYRYNAALIREIAARKLVEQGLRKAAERLRASTAQIEATREDERTRLAREIHDELGQALTGLKMDLSWLEKRIPGNQAEAAGRTKSMFRLIDAALQGVQRISSALRPQVLDDVGLIATLRWQAKEFQVRTGIRCKTDLPIEEPELGRVRSTAAFRILQEALTNVARHAGATRVDIGLQVDGGHLILRIADNGRGVSEAELHDPKSLGLLGIRERAFLLGGDVGIEGRGGRGTTITLSIPLRTGTRSLMPAMGRGDIQT